MRNVEKWFPALFSLPFLFATTQLDVLRMPSELARWGMLMAACGLALWHGLQRGPRGRVGWLPCDGICLAFLAVFGVSALWSISPVYSVQRTVSLALLYGAAFWYAWGYADRFGERKLISMLLRPAAIILGVNLVVFGIVDPASVVAMRFQGYFENPNNIGLICSISLPLVFSEMLRRRGWWVFFEFGVFLLSLLACGSRTGLIASGTAMLLIGASQALRGNTRAIRLGFLFVGFVGVLSVTTFFQENVAREGTIETLSNRTYFWELARQDYIPKRPWNGHGFGTDGLIHDYYGVTLSDLKLRGYGVMSSYYGLAVSVGIPLAVGFFSAIAWVTVRCLRHFRRDGTSVVYGAVIIAGMLVGITESALYSVGNCFAYLFWIVVMLASRRDFYLHRAMVSRCGQRELARKRAMRERRIRANQKLQTCKECRSEDAKCSR